MFGLKKKISSSKPTSTINSNDVLLGMQATINELQTALAYEKGRRIFWQDLTYSAMVTVDSVLGHNFRNGDGANEDNFKQHLAQVYGKCKEKDDRIAELEAALV